MSPSDTRYKAHESSHTDIIYEPDFMRKYNTFWRSSTDLTRMAQLDLREIALLFIIIAFGILLEQVATSRPTGISPSNTSSSRDMRPASAISDLDFTQMEREELSLTWSWATKRAISEASRFYGPSLDIVRAGTMVSIVRVLKSA